MPRLSRPSLQRVAPMAVISLSLFLFVPTLLGQAIGDGTSPPFTVEVRDFTPKFLTFYSAAKAPSVTEPQRWSLFERLDGFLAVPPTTRGREEGRKLLDQAWEKYPGVMDRIKQGASGLQPSPQKALDAVASLFEVPETASPEKIVLVPFVGTFDHNAFAAKSSDGKPMVALPIEVTGSEVTMAHEFTHIVNENLGGLWKTSPQTVGTLMFTEGLAMRASEKLDPGQPEFSYVSFNPEWYSACQQKRIAVLDSLKPRLVETSEQFLTQFTYGTGGSGLTREAYCGGWFVVGDLLNHGWTFPALARLSREQINPLVARTVAELSQQPSSGTLQAPGSKQPQEKAETEDVKQSNFRGRLYRPAASSARNMGILLIGGTEGHLYTADEIGPRLAALGYFVLGVDYHDAYDGGRKFANVPIESFTSAAAWLRTKLPAQKGMVTVLGYSRGTEGALLTAVYAPEIAGVVLFSPSSVVWGAMGSTDPSGPSGWSYQGKPIPYLLPESQVQGGASFAAALSNPQKVDAALIPVGKIQGQIFMAASDDDAIWPSGQMARQLQTEFEAAHTASPVTLMEFNHASHRLLGQGPSAPTETYKSPDATRIINFGGTALGNEEARNSAWAALLKFLRQLEITK
jgi:dienelactone hydrolase